MKLYLLRHAQANSPAVDPEKGLSPEGVAQAKKMSESVSQLANLEVKVVLYSSKQRARQTAEIMVEKMLPAPRIMQTNNLEPEGDVQVWVERALTSEENVMLVGHLPHLGRLAACLLSRDESKEVVEFTTATLACLVRDSDGNWHLDWLLRPDAIRA